MHICKKEYKRKNFVKSNNTVYIYVCEQIKVLVYISYNKQNYNYRQFMHIHIKLFYFIEINTFDVK